MQNRYAYIFFQHYFVYVYHIKRNKAVIGFYRPGRASRGESEKAKQVQQVIREFAVSTKRSSARNTQSPPSVYQRATIRLLDDRPDKTYYQSAMKGWGSAIYDVLRRVTRTVLAGHREKRNDNRANCCNSILYYIYIILINNIVRRNESLDAEQEKYLHVWGRGSQTI